MKNDPLPNPIRELAWRRKLSPEQEAELRAWLAAHPEAHDEWEADSAVTEGLARLPDAPVSSNFTARVLQAVEAEAGTRQRTGGGAAWREVASWRKWLPRAAVAGVVVGAVLLGVRHHQRAEYARSVVMLSNIASLPGPGVLENFDAIHALERGPAPDVDLLKALQ